MSAAITEQVLALDALKKEIDRIFEAAMEDVVTEDRRPIMPSLKRDSLEAVARTTRGAEILLAEAQRVLENTEDDPSALGVSFQPIMSLKQYWEPVFGSYKTLAAALKKNEAVPQKQKGRRFLVDVAAFLSWIDAVKNLSASHRFDPKDRATWTDEDWQAISEQFAAHLREKRTIRDDKRQQSG